MNATGVAPSAAGERRRDAAIATRRRTKGMSAELADGVETIEAWRCVGCGRLEGPRPCVGVCQDRKVSFVYASDYDAALARLREAEARSAILESLATRMALATPRRGGWEKSYRALQEEARRVLREARARGAASAAEAEAASSR